jgi:hypothetical protein
MHAVRQVGLNVTEAAGAVFIGTASVATLSAAAIGVVVAEFNVLKTTTLLFVKNFKTIFAAFW